MDTNYYYINDEDFNTIINYLDFLYYNEPISREKLRVISYSLKTQKINHIDGKEFENGRKV